MRRYTLFKRAYMAHTETAWLKIHDLSFVPPLLRAFADYTGYKSLGAAADAWYCQRLEMRCSAFPTFDENRAAIMAVVNLAKEYEKRK